MAIHRATESFGPVADTVGFGRRIVERRRGAPLGALFPKNDHAVLVELHERDRQIAAVLKGRGVLVELSNTANLMQALAKVAERS